MNNKTAEASANYFVKDIAAVEGGVNSEFQYVSEGYRQTEVGVIPNDWVVNTFGQICWVNQGLQIAIDRRKKYPTSKSKVYITVQYVNSGDEPEYIDDYTSAVCCDPDEVLMTRTGNTGIVVTGETGVFHNNFFKINFNREKINSGFFVYYLRSRNCQKTILEKAGTSTIPDLNHGDFYSIQIPLPPFPEQTAIANALSDVDALITSLEKLIEKKRAIKTAAMQELLTGKKRLPPFDKIKIGYKKTELGEIPGDWEVKPIGSALSIRHGKDQKEVEKHDGIYPILGTGGEMGRTDKFLYDKPSVLIGRKGTINKPRYIESPFWTVDTLFYSEVNENFSGKYIYYKFCLIDWMAYNEASGVPSLNASTIESVLQSFPIDRDEQVAIADVLSDMDKEIETLENRLNKTQQIKQGMMQELLTGRTRLL